MAGSGSAPTRSRPGRHRSEAVDQAILAAALDLLAEDGYGAMTMASVIARSGVSSATLYRRWTTKQDLVAAALASLHPATVDVDTGSLEGDVTALVSSVAESMSVQRDDLSEAVAQALRGNPDFRAAVNDKFVTPRILVLGHVLDRARQRGELGGGLTAEVALSFVNGPLHHRVYVMAQPATPRFLRGVVRAAVASLRALAPPD